MPQLLNKNIFLIWKIKLLWFTDNEYENKVQNVFAKEIYVLRGNNLFDFANTFTALKKKKKKKHFIWVSMYLARKY